MIELRIDYIKHLIIMNTLKIKNIETTLFE